MSLRTNTLDLHGQAGAEWLARIPELLEHCLAQWSLSLGASYSDASYSYVVRVERQDGTPAVLKLSFPGEQVDREADCLRAFAGRGSIALHQYDRVAGALLLQRAEPGHHLAQLCWTDDVHATTIATRMVRQLPSPIPADTTWPSIDAWRLDIQRISQAIELDPAVSALASDALPIAAELATSSSERVLLHGDLHQFNIIAAGDEWLCIDPVGVVGERACEIAPLVLNPVALLRSADLSELIRRRINQLSDDSGLDRRRARAWTFVRTMLAILWSLEDHRHAPEEWIALAEILRRDLFR